MREMSEEFSMRERNRQVASLRSPKPTLSSGAATNVIWNFRRLWTVSTQGLPIFSEIGIIIRDSLVIPRSRLEVLTNTVSREYIPQCWFEGSRSFLGSLLWLFAFVQGKLLPRDNQGSKESSGSVQLIRGQSERMLLPRCRWRMRRLSWKTKAAKSRHLPLMAREAFARRYRPVTTKSPSKEGSPASAASALSKSTLSQAR
jgi:hypothetical protein